MKSIEKNFIFEMKIMFRSSSSHYMMMKVNFPRVILIRPRKSFRTLFMPLDHHRNLLRNSFLQPSQHFMSSFIKLHLFVQTSCYDPSRFYARDSNFKSHCLVKENFSNMIKLFNIFYFVFVGLSMDFYS